MTQPNNVLNTNDMNNEEKVKKIVDSVFKSGLNTNHSFYDMTYNSALEMAQWKDEQFDKKLQEIVDYVYPRILGGERLHINEIIGKDMVWKH